MWPEKKTLSEGSTIKHLGVVFFVPNYQTRSHVTLHIASILSWVSFYGPPTLRAALNNFFFSI